MKQVARNVSGRGGDLEGARHLVHDRDSKHTRFFDEIFKAAGTEPLKLPARSPNLNAYAERFVKTIKTECLDHLILFGEKSLRHVVTEYLAHYHAQRNHQGTKNVIPFPDSRSNRSGNIVKVLL